MGILKRERKDRAREVTSAAESDGEPVPSEERSASAAASSSPDDEGTADMPGTGSSESSSSKTNLVALKASAGKDGSLSAGKIAGISIASAAIVCGLLMACLCCWKKSKGTANIGERGGKSRKGATTMDHAESFVEYVDEDSEKGLEVGSNCESDDRNPHLIFPSQDRQDFKSQSLDDAI